MANNLNLMSTYLAREAITLRLAPSNVDGTGDATKFSDYGPFTVRYYGLNTFTNQPTQYGFLLNIAGGQTSQESHSLWFEQANGSLFHKGTNGSNYAANTVFKKILDDSNYASVLDDVYVNVNGDTMTGSLTFTNDSGIYYQGTKANYRMIRFIDNTADEYGNGISIGGGGLTVLGSGESADTILSNLSLTSSGGTETTYIGSDGSIEFYPSINSWDAAARISMTAGSLWAGVDGNTTRENQIGVQSGAGRIYMYAQASATGGRGIYIPAHGSGGARAVFSIGTNNEVYFADGYNGTATRLAYSQAGLAGSAISWLTCWNGYELRAINAANTRQFLFGSSSIGNANTPIYYDGTNLAQGNNKLGAAYGNSYWGMRAADNSDAWIRTTTSGIIPVQSGGAGSGHSNLGTSTWYFSAAYIDNIYGTLSGTATNANNLAYNTRLEYGWNGVNYFNFSGTAGAAAKVNDSPTTQWWHILRFNHANASGYYTDLAIPFNHNCLYYKRVQAGALQNGGWVKILDKLTTITVVTSLTFTSGRAVYSNSAITSTSRIFVTGCNDGSTGMIFSTGVPWTGNVEIHGCDYYSGNKLNWSGTKNNIKILIDNS